MAKRLKPLKLDLMGGEWDVRADLDAAASTDPDVAGDMGETLRYEHVITVYWPEHERLRAHPESTVLHELVHAVLAQSGLADQLEALDESGGLEEAIVVALENGLGPHIELSKPIRRWVAKTEAAWGRRLAKRWTPDPADSD